jgi:hypothetical protein
MSFSIVTDPVKAINHFLGTVGKGIVNESMYAFLSTCIFIVNRSNCLPALPPPRTPCQRISNNTPLHEVSCLDRPARRFPLQVDSTGFSRSPKPTVA